MAEFLDKTYDTLEPLFLPLQRSLGIECHNSSFVSPPYVAQGMNNRSSNLEQQMHILCLYTLASCLSWSLIFRLQKLAMLAMQPPKTLCSALFIEGRVCISHS